MRHYRIELLIKSDLTEEQVAERVEGRPGPVFGGQVARRRTAKARMAKLTVHVDRLPANGDSTSPYRHNYRHPGDSAMTDE
ncbi:putative primase [Mycobacterium phage 33D]|nr:putative primase [Mycobacterium phage 33D]